jgi:transcriptional regulator with XRE-family HTH domain
MTEKVGKKIAAALTRLEKSQGWLAGEMGVSDNAVSKWVRSGKVAKTNIPKLAQLLGLSVDQLLSDTAEPVAVVSPSEETKLERLDASEAQLVAYYRECGDIQRRFLLSHAKMLAVGGSAVDSGLGIGNQTK